jgi:hypothetical protein
MKGASLEKLTKGRAHETRPSTNISADLETFTCHTKRE